MSQVPVPDVFTVSEIASAAAVPVEAVRALLESGELAFVADTVFIAVSDPARAGRRLREVALTLRPPDTHELFDRENIRESRSRKPAAWSLAAHAALVAFVIWLSTGRIETAPADDSVHEDTHLVFLLSPGPGGGGGGGGERAPKPAPKIARLGKAHADVSVPIVEQPRESDPTPAPAPPEPPPPQPVMAPVAAVAANDQDRQGQIEHAVEAPDSRGQGNGGGVGTGQGTGNGDGQGSGIGEGEGGGTGGGPYRPGSGIDPPRLLHEVKAEYTEDARRHGITGDVELEIVVRRDGAVGDVHVLRGLGAGLDERAIAAVKQWRFDPARRKGIPVDVLVEVAVEFTLR
jgi:TonB family protein